MTFYQEKGRVKTKGAGREAVWGEGEIHKAYKHTNSQINSGRVPFIRFKLRKNTCAWVWKLVGCGLVVFCTIYHTDTHTNSRVRIEVLVRHIPRSYTSQRKNPHIPPTISSSPRYKDIVTVITFPKRWSRKHHPRKHPSNKYPLPLSLVPRSPERMRIGSHLFKTMTVAMTTLVQMR